MKKTFILALLIVALSGCGLKGALYLPDYVNQDSAPTAPSDVTR